MSMEYDNFLTVREQAINADSDAEVTLDEHIEGIIEEDAIKEDNPDFGKDVTMAEGDSIEKDDDDDILEIDEDNDDNDDNDAVVDDIGNSPVEGEDAVVHDNDEELLDFVDEEEKLIVSTSPGAHEEKFTQGVTDNDEKPVDAAESEGVKVQEEDREEEQILEESGSEEEQAPEEELSEDEVAQERSSEEQSEQKLEAEGTSDGEDEQETKTNLPDEVEEVEDPERRDSEINEGSEVADDDDNNDNEVEEISSTNVDDTDEPEVTQVVQLERNSSLSIPILLETDVSRCLLVKPPATISITAEQLEHFPILFRDDAILDKNVDSLFHLIRETEELKDDFKHEQELVLSVTQLELSISEDNYYAAEVSILDLINLKVKDNKKKKQTVCKFENLDETALTLRLSSQKRFITQFNNLCSELIPSDTENSTTPASDDVQEHTVEISDEEEILDEVEDEAEEVSPSKRHLEEANENNENEEVPKKFKRDV